MLAGVPVLALVLGLALRRLQSVGTPYREQQGRVTGRVVEVVAGLGVLNGLGGKGVYADRIAEHPQRHQLQRPFPAVLRLERQDPMQGGAAMGEVSSEGALSFPAMGEDAKAFMGEVDTIQELKGLTATSP